MLSLPPGVTGGGLRPYAVIGGGLIHAEAEDFFEVFQVRRTVPAINLGVGAIGLLTNNVGVRFDVRHLRSLSKDASIGAGRPAHRLLAIHDRPAAAPCSCVAYVLQRHWL